MRREGGRGKVRDIMYTTEDDFPVYISHNKRR